MLPTLSSLNSISRLANHENATITTLESPVNAKGEDEQNIVEDEEGLFGLTEQMIESLVEYSKRQANAHYHYYEQQTKNVDSRFDNTTSATTSSMSAIEESDDAETEEEQLFVLTDEMIEQLVAFSKRQINHVHGNCCSKKL